MESAFVTNDRSLVNLERPSGRTGSRLDRYCECSRGLNCNCKERLTPTLWLNTSGEDVPLPSKHLSRFLALTQLGQDLFGDGLERVEDADACRGHRFDDGLAFALKLCREVCCGDDVGQVALVEL